MSKSTAKGYDPRLIPVLKRLHWPEFVPATAKTPESAVCKRCRSLWPCDVSQVLNVVDIQNDALERIYHQCTPGAGECTDCERAQRWAAQATLEDYPVAPRREGE